MDWREKRKMRRVRVFEAKRRGGLPSKLWLNLESRFLAMTSVEIVAMLGTSWNSTKYKVHNSYEVMQYDQLIELRIQVLSNSNISLASNSQLQLIGVHVQAAGVSAALRENTYLSHTPATQPQ